LIVVDFVEWGVVHKLWLGNRDISFIYFGEDQHVFIRNSGESKCHYQRSNPKKNARKLFQIKLFAERAKEFEIAYFTIIYVIRCLNFQNSDFHSFARLKRRNPHHFLRRNFFPICNSFTLNLHNF
jgi:hypothetical protein